MLEAAAPGAYPDARPSSLQRRLRLRRRGSFRVRREWHAINEQIDCSGGLREQHEHGERGGREGRSKHQTPPILMKGTYRNNILPKLSPSSAISNPVLEQSLSCLLPSQLLALHGAAHRKIKRDRQIVAEALGNAGV